MIKNMEIVKADPIYCSGFRSPENCLNNGVYVESNKECKECKADAMEALNEAFKNE